MGYPVQCDCGTLLNVTAARAGSSVSCHNCGHEVLVPPLSILRRQYAADGEDHPVTVTKTRTWKAIVQTVGVLFGLFLLVSVVRELGFVDFHRYSSSSVTYSSSPCRLLGKKPGKIQSAKIYLAEGDMHRGATNTRVIWEQRFSESGCVLEIWIKDYYDAAALSLYVPIYKVGTHRAYFYWESAVDGHMTNFGRSDFIRESRIIGMCSVRHIRTDAFNTIVGEITKQIQKEATEADGVAKQ